MKKLIQRWILRRKAKKIIKEILNRVLNYPDYQAWTYPGADTMLFLSLKKYIDIFNQGKDGQSYHERIKQAHTNMTVNDYELLHDLMMHYFFQIWGSELWGEPSKGYYKTF